MPPGPWGMPFLGVFHKISPDRPHQTYTEWAKKYGDVMSFTLFGTQKAVVVSSEQAIREVLVNKEDQFSGKLGRRESYFTGLHTQKAYTHTGTSSLQILMLSAHAYMHFA